MTTPAGIPTTDLLRLAGLAAEDLESAAATCPEVAPYVALATRTIRVGVSTARGLRDDDLRRRFVAGSLRAAGETLTGALDRRPALAELAATLRDDALACLSLARAALEAA